MAIEERLILSDPKSPMKGWKESPGGKVRIEKGWEPPGEGQDDEFDLSLDGLGSSPFPTERSALEWGAEDAWRPPASAPTAPEPQGALPESRTDVLSAPPAAASPAPPTISWENVGEAIGKAASAVGGFLSGLRERLPSGPLEAAFWAIDPSLPTTAALEAAGVPGHEERGFSVGPIEIGPRELAGAAVAGVVNPFSLLGKAPVVLSKLTEGTARALSKTAVDVIGVREAISPPYVSRLSSVLRGINWNVMPPQQLLATLKGKVRDMDMEVTGFYDFLRDKIARGERVTKEEALSFLDNSDIYQVLSATEVVQVDRPSLRKPLIGEPDDVDWSLTPKYIMHFPPNLVPTPQHEVIAQQGRAGSIQAAERILDFFERAGILSRPHSYYSDREYNDLWSRAHRIVYENLPDIRGRGYALRSDLGYREIVATVPSVASYAIFDPRRTDLLDIVREPLFGRLLVYYKGGPGEPQLIATLWRGADVAASVRGEEGLKELVALMQFDPLYLARRTAAAASHWPEATFLAQSRFVRAMEGDPHERVLGLGTADTRYGIPLFHVRADERWTASGDKVLFVGEVQSDLYQRLGSSPAAKEEAQRLLDQKAYSSKDAERHLELLKRAAALIDSIPTDRPEIASLVQDIRRFVGGDIAAEAKLRRPAPRLLGSLGPMLSPEVVQKLESVLDASKVNELDELLAEIDALDGVLATGALRVKSSLPSDDPLHHVVDAVETSLRQLERWKVYGEGPGVLVGPLTPERRKALVDVMTQWPLGQDWVEVALRRALHEGATGDYRYLAVAGWEDAAKWDTGARGNLDLLSDKTKEGLKYFYSTVVPSALSKLASKYGGKIVEVPLSYGGIGPSRYRYFDIPRTNQVFRLSSEVFPKSLPRYLSSLVLKGASGETVTELLRDAGMIMYADAEAMRLSVDTLSSSNRSFFNTFRRPWPLHEAIGNYTEAMETAVNRLGGDYARALAPVYSSMLQRYKGGSNLRALVPSFKDAVFAPTGSGVDAIVTPTSEVERLIESKGQLLERIRNDPVIQRVAYLDPHPVNDNTFVALASSLVDSVASDMTRAIYMIGHISVPNYRTSASARALDGGILYTFSGRRNWYSVREFLDRPLAPTEKELLRTAAAYLGSASLQDTLMSLSMAYDMSGLVLSVMHTLGGDAIRTSGIATAALPIRVLDVPALRSAGGWEAAKPLIDKAAYALPATTNGMVTHSRSWVLDTSFPEKGWLPQLGNYSTHLGEGAAESLTKVARNALDVLDENVDAPFVSALKYNIDELRRSVSLARALDRNVVGIPGWSDAVDRLISYLGEVGIILPKEGIHGGPPVNLAHFVHLMRLAREAGEIGDRQLSEQLGLAAIGVRAKKSILEKNAPKRALGIELTPEVRRRILSEGLEPAKGAKSPPKPPQTPGVGAGQDDADSMGALLVGKRVAPPGMPPAMWPPMTFEQARRVYEWRPSSMITNSDAEEVVSPSMPLPLLSRR